MVVITKKNENNKLNYSFLEFNITGDEINSIVVNSIRRIILSEIPVHIFEEFHFSYNDTIYNNNQMKLRIKNIPVWGIDTSAVLGKNKDPKNTVNENTIPVKNKENEDKLTMHIDITNNNNDIIHVTTDHAKFYYKNESIQSPYIYPVQLLKLQKNQSINFTAVTNVGIEKTDALYSPVSVAYYKELSDTSFDFILESRGQYTEKDILILAVNILLKKLTNILTSFTNVSNKPNQFMINDEDHTIGNLLSKGMNLNDSVKFAGYHMIHPLDTNVVIKYELVDNNQITDVVRQVIHYYRKIFTDILNKIETKL
jgi:DNA-directed RNA polymerase subunit L